MATPAIAEDRVTRERLIEAAGQLFADHGFRKVTVREICRVARANVAAVNYHFGDKLGLYREVLDTAISAQEATTAAARAAGEGLPADQKLRAFVQTFVERVVGHRPTWVRGLMFREMSDPTPGARRLRRARHPSAIRLPLRDRRRPARLSRDRRPRPALRRQRAVAADDGVPNPIGARLRPGHTPGPADIAQLIEHITAFSLAGIKQMREVRS
jgi:AcrR family transcriptional regulator